MRSKLLIRVIRWFILFGILGTIFLYWKLNNYLAAFSSLDRWAIALDISLAHMVATFPLIVLSIIVVLIVVALAYKLIDFIAQLIPERSTERQSGRNKIISGLMFGLDFGLHSASCSSSIWSR